MTPPPTQVEEVEHINRIAKSKEVRFEVANQVAKKLKRNWGRKVAKQQHQECNETALKVTKQKVKASKYAKCQQKWVDNRRMRRERNLQIIHGSAVMDSGTTSTVIKPNDNQYIIDTKVPSNKLFTVATGETTRGGNQAILKNGLRGKADTQTQFINQYEQIGG